MPEIEAVRRDADERERPPVERAHERAVAQRQRGAADDEEARDRRPRRARVVVEDEQPDRIDASSQTSPDPSRPRSRTSRASAEQHAGDEEERGRQQRVDDARVADVAVVEQVHAQPRAGKPREQQQHRSVAPRAAREPREADGDQWEQRVELQLDHQRPHRAVHGQRGGGEEVLGERREARPLAEGAAALLHDEQHDHDRVVERQRPQQAVDRVAAQVHPLAAERRRCQRAESR